MVLHAVTHPCPRDLSVLLVHDEQKYLLMNNVGGCRPLQGTTIEFVSDVNAPTIPRFPSDVPPFPNYMRVQASFDGPQPTPPPPFPSGGFIISGAPPDTVRIDGQWDLYIIDKEQGSRGVVAGGWSLNYDTTLRSTFRQTDAGAWPHLLVGPRAGLSHSVRSEPGARGAPRVTRVAARRLLA